MHRLPGVRLLIQTVPWQMVTELDHVSATIQMNPVLALTDVSSREEPIRSEGTLLI